MQIQVPLFSHTAWNNICNTNLLHNLLHTFALKSHFLISFDFSNHPLQVLEQLCYQNITNCFAENIFFFFSFNCFVRMIWLFSLTCLCSDEANIWVLKYWHAHLLFMVNQWWQMCTPTLDYHLYSNAMFNTPITPITYLKPKH